MRATQRFCLECFKITTFRYKRSIGHSSCELCGNRFAINRRDIKYSRLLEISEKFISIKNILDDIHLSNRLKISRLRKIIEGE